MGYRLRADHTAPKPYPVSMRLDCDGRCRQEPGLFGFGHVEIDVTSAIPREAARKAGWQIIDSLAFCPSCAKEGEE